MRKWSYWLKGSLIVVILIGLFSFNTLRDDYFEIARNLDIFATLFRELNNHYVDEIDPEDLISTGIQAMLSSLDPYTTFIPEQSLEDYKTSTTGQYGGIGAVVSKRNGVNTVIMPYAGFPAHKAGLQIGDQIIKIDDQDLYNKSTTEISELLKGQPNTPIKLTIIRYGHDDEMDIEMNRATITIDNISYSGMVNESVGFIRLSDFTTDAGKEVSAAVNELKKQGARQLVLDLRGNPGGLLDEAIKVANVFIPKGAEIVNTKGRLASLNEIYKAPSEPVDDQIPLVVLTSNGTASAAEIVSGVVQDYDRGVLIGKKTFGKGLVQTTRSLPYDAQLKITSAKYYIPSGRCIQAIDYSHRNEDGSVGKIPDSLKVAFKTKHGRTVYDGGGIDPDIEVNIEYYSNLLVNLINQNIIFDYASKYHFEHEQIVSPREFQLSDSEYLEFVEWTKDKELDFSTEMDQAIVKLEGIAKDEKYYEGMESQLEQLKKKVKDVQTTYLMKYQDEVKFFLKEEIVGRYYLHPGVIEASIDHDPAIQKALSVLSDEGLYKKLLSN